jgi:curved DNA-binding protein CbpA
MKDHYETLDVPPDASQDTIREQYLLLIQAWHPDKFSNPAQKAKAEEKSKEINAAYEVLKHAQKRAEYDRRRNAGSSLFNAEEAHKQAEEERQWQAEEQRRQQAAEQRQRERARERQRPIDDEASHSEGAGKKRGPIDEERRKREEAETRAHIRKLVEYARTRRKHPKQPPAGAKGTSEHTIRVLLADFLKDRRAQIRSGVGDAPDITICGEASNGLEAITQFNALKPDVMVIYLNMPEIDGIAATNLICEKYPDARVIIMTVQSGADYIKRAMLAGACDYLVMPFTADDLISAIRQAVA